LCAGAAIHAYRILKQFAYQTLRIRFNIYDARDACGDDVFGAIVTGESSGEKHTARGGRTASCGICDCGHFSVDCPNVINGRGELGVLHDRPGGIAEGEIDELLLRQLRHCRHEPSGVLQTPHDVAQKGLTHAIAGVTSQLKVTSVGIVAGPVLAPSGSRNFIASD
jgi:hypothetical protein